jgi:hypothetical protein
VSPRVAHKQGDRPRSVELIARAIIVAFAVKLSVLPLWALILMVTI